MVKVWWWNDTCIINHTRTVMISIISKDVPYTRIYKIDWYTPFIFLYKVPTNDTNHFFLMLVIQFLLCCILHNITAMWHVINFRQLWCLHPVHLFPLGTVLTVTVLYLCFTMQWVVIVIIVSNLIPVTCNNAIASVSPVLSTNNSSNMEAAKADKLELVGERLAPLP